MYRTAIAILASLAAFGCGPPGPAGPDMILTGATIYPSPGADPVEALAIQGNEVIAVGSDAEIRALASDDTQEMALEGAVVLPGFHDAWVDLFKLSAVDRRVDLRLTTSERDVQAKLRAALPSHEGAVIGWGWDERRWPSAAAPTSAALDTVATDQTIVLYRRDGRVAWLNSAALEAAQVADQTLTLNGLRTGLVGGAALAVVDQMLQIEESELVREGVLGAFRAAAAAGLTSIATAPLSEQQAGLLASLDPAEITIRVHGRVAPGVRPPAPAGRLLFDAVGVEADGPIALGLAARDDNASSLADIDAACAAATAAALPLDVQVRGEGGVARAAACPVARLIVGADLMPPTDFTMSAKFVAVPGRMTHDMYWLDDVVGADVELAHSYRTWARQGWLGGIASDAPANDLRPVEALRAMFTRRDREGFPLDGWRATERLSPVDTARAALSAGAVSSEIAPGRPADLVVWSEDFFASDETIARAQAMLVFVDGRVIYSRPLVTPNLDRRQRP